MHLRELDFSGGSVDFGSARGAFKVSLKGSTNSTSACGSQVEASPQGSVNLRGIGGVGEFTGVKIL